MNRTFLEAMDARRGANTDPSDYMLDRWLAGELSATDAAALEARLANDDAFRARTQALMQDNAAPLPVFRVGHGRAMVPVWKPLLAASAALLIALPFLLRVDEPGARTKGGPTLALHLKRGDASVLVPSPSELAPGDQLQLTVTSTKEAFVALVASDERGVVTSYYPLGQHQTVSVAPGRDVRVSHSFVLDEAAGNELWLGIACASAFDFSTWLVQAHGSVGEAERVLRGDAGNRGDACEITRWQVTKRAR